ncbi:hypothetical protein AB832_05485 [Flavobacteriaceae bacterium (ex Bugula neritina AB1)]|nr:hypothetical protein AB832_05485 [Flavobacteriaceae bacterium (ex Bugula neritina AB1)]
MENKTFTISYALIHFHSILFLYALSGYMIANEKDRFVIVGCSIITGIGVSLWIYCMYQSSGNLDWRHGNAGVWLLYRMYIAGIEFPLGCAQLRFLEYNNPYLLLGYSFIPIVFQSIGILIKRCDVKLLNHEFKV